MRAHRRRLSLHDLEDCYSQATLEILLRAHRGGRFASELHVANALDQRFACRIRDRRRAYAGRSPIQAATACAAPLDGEDDRAGEIADPRADVPELAHLRERLRRVSELACRLTGDQRLALTDQLLGNGDCAHFCERHGWSAEKYRKVVQRARARLRA
jgi:DNA-directed RNA polymerase specialized sigma24 family protein